MPEQDLRTCAYRLVRYYPNLVRDEWINIGVLLWIPSDGVNPERVRQRWLDDPPDLLRLRRLHPSVDEELLLRLPAAFESEFASRGTEPEAVLEKLDDTFANAVQLAPRKGLLSPDPDAELERLYREQIEPIREVRRTPSEVRSRGDVRHRAAEVFQSAKVLRFMQRGVRVAEYTTEGDPMRIDFAYRRNGTRGFVQALSLARDPGQAKLLAYTAGAIRERLPRSEFLAITEREPARANGRDRFVSKVLEEADVRVMPLGAPLIQWTHQVAPLLRANEA